GSEKFIDRDDAAARDVIGKRRICFAVDLRLIVGGYSDGPAFDDDFNRPAGVVVVAGDVGEGPVGGATRSVGETSAQVQANERLAIDPGRRARRPREATADGSGR